MKCPDSITDQILAFTNGIVSGGQPIYLNCEPLVGKPPGECFPIVDEHVMKHGGHRELGWCIYQWPNVFIEGELHSVWVDPKGIRRDIAPHQLPMKRILFLPDPAAIYRDQCQVNNHRKALGEDPLIAQFIQAANDVFAEENRGEFASKNHFVATKQWRDAQARKAACELELVQRYGFPPGVEDLFSDGAGVAAPAPVSGPKIGRNEPCPCGSQRKFKRCCGV